MPKVLWALLAQFIALAILALMVWLAPNWFEPPYHPAWLVLLQSLLVLVITAIFKLNRWWYGIQFILPWLWYLGLSYQFDPVISLVLFVFIVLIFANAFQERVPLYLTNATARKAFRQVLREYFSADARVSFVDLGCGIGGNVRYMAGLPGVFKSHGVETAPIPFLLGWLNLFLFKLGVRIRAIAQDDSAQALLQNTLNSTEIFSKDLWKLSLVDYDLVYVFLSTEPMPKLWRKAVQEMRPGSVLVSNSFPVPDIEPTEVWQLNDRRQTVLYLYRMDKPGA